jgi:hypothetical protein
LQPAGLPDVPVEEENVPVDIGVLTEHARVCIEAITQDNRWGILVVELYSGCGQHGRTVARTLRQVLSLEEGKNDRLKRGRVEDKPRRRPPVVLLSIDREVGVAGTSLVVDARGLVPENLHLLKKKFTFMAVVLLASPPCIEYSVAMNTRPRELDKANELVRIVQSCHEVMQAVCTVMENPAYPGLLPGRAVADFLPHTRELNYCAHGGQFWKKTQLWSGSAKYTGPDGFSLERYGFKAKLCGGVHSCPIILYDAFKGEWQHPQWEGSPLVERQAIPFQVSRPVGGAIGVFLNQLPEL